MNKVSKLARNKYAEADREIDVKKLPSNVLIFSAAVRVHIVSTKSGA